VRIDARLHITCGIYVEIAAATGNASLKKGSKKGSSLPLTLVNRINFLGRFSLIRGEYVAINMVPHCYRFHKVVIYRRSVVTNGATDYKVVMLINFIGDLCDTATATIF
jgi:hypothetical protein